MGANGTRDQSRRDATQLCSRRCHKQYANQICAWRCRPVDQSNSCHQLLFLVTLPLLIPAAVSFFQSAELASQLSITETVIQTFLITAVPVAIGLLVSELLNDVATRARSICTMIASFLFAVIVIGLVAMNWDLFMTNVARLGPLCLLPSTS